MSPSDHRKLNVNIMTPTNPQPEMEISKEALKVHEAIIAQNDMDLAHPATVGSYAEERQKNGREVFLLPRDIQYAFDQSTAPLMEELAKRDRELIGILNMHPNAVRVCEGGGPENLDASVALLVAMQKEEIEMLNEALQRREQQIAQSETNWGRERSYLTKDAMQLQSKITQLQNKLATYEGQTNFCCECGGTKEQITQLEKQVLGLKEFLRDVESNWDCDNGAHGTHSPHCRACKAKELLLGMTGLSTNYTKREVLEKCVYELHKQIKHLHSSSAYYQSGQAVITLATEELKKGQS